MDRSGAEPAYGSQNPLTPAGQLVLAVVTTLLLAGCGSSPGKRDPEDGFAADRLPQTGGAPGLVIDFETADTLGSPITSIRVTGGGTASATSVSLGSGEVRTTLGADGGAAARFPSNAESAAGARGVLRVDGLDPGALSPGKGDFQFGVDLMYPEDSAGDAVDDQGDDQGDGDDDGDNVFQRGLFGDQGQFKLQVDHGQPACRIAGGGKETLVKARETLESGQWYRLLCQRAEGEVTIFVAEVDSAAEDLAWDSWSVPDRSGEIPRTEAPVPVSIGGKLNQQGEIVRDAPDQFNGVLDNVVFLSLSR